MLNDSSLLRKRANDFKDEQQNATNPSALYTSPQDTQASAKTPDFPWIGVDNTFKYRMLPSQWPTHEDLYNDRIKAHYKILPVVTQRISFFGLPNELRLRIYELTVREANVISPGRNSPEMPLAQENDRQPAFALVSRQLREEVLPVYYSKNNFLITLCDPLEHVVYNSKDALAIQKARCAWLVRCDRWRTAIRRNMLAEIRSLTVDFVDTCCHWCSFHLSTTGLFIKLTSLMGISLANSTYIQNRLSAWLRELGPHWDGNTLVALAKFLDTRSFQDGFGLTIEMQGPYQTRISFTRTLPAQQQAATKVEIKEEFKLGSGESRA